VLGYDHTESSGSNVATWVAEPSLRWHYRAGERLTWCGRGRQLPRHCPERALVGRARCVHPELAYQDLRALYVGSALVETLWRPTPRWLIRPGVRTDVYNDKDTTKSGFDLA